MVFDHTHPGFPPDVIFSAKDELIEFEPNIDQLEVHYTHTPHTHTTHRHCSRHHHDTIAKKPLFTCVQVFSEWSVRNTDCLCQLLAGLLLQYREHHKALVSQSHRLHFELQSLLQSGEYSEVDVHCSRLEEVCHCVCSLYVVFFSIYEHKFSRFYFCSEQNVCVKSSIRG